MTPLVDIECPLCPWLSGYYPRAKSLLRLRVHLARRHRRETRMVFESVRSAT